MNTPKKSTDRFTGLACPLDGMTLQCIHHGLKPVQLCCANGHAFDISRQGYANLLSVQEKRSRDPGDTRLMIEARSRVLGSGIYARIAHRLSGIIIQHLAHHAEAGSSSCQTPDITVMDAGCGDGYYLEYCMQSVPQFQHGSVIGLDISKWAIAAAAKRNNAITWLVGSNRNPPVQPESIDIIICGFGFPVFSAFRKILKPGGIVIMLDPGENHLLELRRIIYPVIKPYRETGFLDAENLGYSIIYKERLGYAADLTQEQIQDILVMSPHLYKASNEAREVAFALKNLEVSIDVNYTVLKV